MVTYGVFTSEDRGGLDLYRQEDPLPAGLEKEIALPEGQLALDGVSTFRLRYLDDEGGWKEDWDSTDIALLDRLPTEVEVTLALDEESPEGERVPGPDHTRVITLPVRPFDLDALRADGGASDPDSEDSDDDETKACVTVQECGFKLLMKLPEKQKGLVYAAMENNGGACYKRGQLSNLDGLLDAWPEVTCP